MSTHAQHEEPGTGTLDFDLVDRLVKSLRISGLSTTAIAAEVGVSRQTVANWTSGRHAPKRTDRQRWALATGVPYEWLETGAKKSTGPLGGAGTTKSFLGESNPGPFHYNRKGQVVIPFPARPEPPSGERSSSAVVIPFPSRSKGQAA